MVEELTELVEEAVYKEFESISDRGGVLGAMDTMVQRGKIQEESLYYERKKHDGSLPLIGVNTLLAKLRGSLSLPRQKAEEASDIHDTKAMRLQVCSFFRMISCNRIVAGSRR